MARCVNIDWLEVYVLEDSRRYPCNADYFRRQGWMVSEREYGTRQYQEMFVLQDLFGNGVIEIRRNPYSGSSEFSGLQENSAHIRLTNRQCYADRPVAFLLDFLAKHDFQLQRIYRLDVCYDFRAFDFGDNPERFIRRYVEKKYSKVNQCKVRCFGDDGWSAIKWESVSWGSHSSMVGTKMYNKTKELQATGHKKPWIVRQWLDCGLVDRLDPLPDVWRIEFSLHSSIRNWLVIEDNSGRKEKKRRIPHRLSMFDGRDLLWQRFQDLAFHYFRFKKVEYNAQVDSNGERTLKRKDLCADKKLFNWDAGHEFLKVDNLPSERKVATWEQRLLNALNNYLSHQYQPELTKAARTIIRDLEDRKISVLTSDNTCQSVERIRLMLATRTDWNLDMVYKVADDIIAMLENSEIW